MYAIVECSGKQYKVAEGDVINVEKLDLAVGSKLTLTPIIAVDSNELMTGSDVKVSVNAEVLSHNKAKKIVVFKYKAKKNERKKQGHRQPFTKLKIVSIK